MVQFRAVTDEQTKETKIVASWSESVVETDPTTGKRYLVQYNCEALIDLTSGVKRIEACRNPIINNSRRLNSARDYYYCF